MLSIPSFQHPDLLRTALTHRSAVNESKAREHNERLEYLGDAVLELVVSEFLYRTKPNDSEGLLTAARTALVRTETLASLARSLKLPEHVLMSRGEVKSGGSLNPSLLADTLEAVIGAIYLDQGLDATRIFLERTLLRDARRTIQEYSQLDAKSKFQELVQRKGFPSPVYEIVDQVGPDHNRMFTARVLVSGKPSGTGKGKSKQEAEQAAAKDALGMV